MKGTGKQQQQQQQQQQEDETSTKQTTGMLYNFIDGFVESVGDEKDSSMVSRSIPKNGNCRSAANNRCIGSNDGNSEKNAGSGTPATGASGASSSLADFELCLLQRRHRPKTDGNVAVRQDTTHDSIDNAMDVILTKQNDDEYVLHLCQVSMALSKNRNGRSDAARRAIRIGASTEFAKMTAAGSKEDSGYLSGGEEIATAAGEEKGDAAQTCGGVSWRRTSCSISEEDTEGSFEDDGCTSESGAESIETHSVFFDKIATGETAAALAKPANDKDGDDETRNVCCAARATQLKAVQHVVFIWIPSQAGIGGNKLADQNAKKAATSDGLINLKLPVANIKMEQEMASISIEAAGAEVKFRTNDSSNLQ
ncbi:unnamed protein product [Acanthoscelides obtectus]|uniref:Uncharacterized protein n=1 Tax=Acanthoscelides obtectus TaxID=200917 RepID=A0A9P0MBZ0_ACAOB|nr:unnamed protein product [Acanthoscelides obtectus]CAK1665502.1 hypothetical protein AOBTE_LOCUS24851 [Acanthoscelides obtectus]